MKSLDGGDWVDLFGIVFLIRLLAVFFHFPSLTMAEAGLWGVTISAFSWYNTQGPKT